MPIIIRWRSVLVEVPEQRAWSTFRAYAYRGIGQRERMELAEAEVCPATSFPTLMLRPGLETRETRGTRRSWLEKASIQPKMPARCVRRRISVTA